MNAEINQYNPYLNEAASAILADDQRKLRDSVDLIRNEINDCATGWLMQAWAAESLESTEQCLKRALGFDADNEIALAGLAWLHGIQATADLQLELQNKQIQTEHALAEEERRFQAENDARALAKERALLRSQEMQLLIQQEEINRTENEAWFQANNAAVTHAESDQHDRDKLTGQVGLQAETSYIQAEGVCVKTIDAAELNQLPVRTLEVDKNINLDSHQSQELATLENCLAKARELPRHEFVDASSEIGERMLQILKSFCKEHMTGASAEQVNAEIEQTQQMVNAFGEILKTRPLNDTLIQAFWNVKESDDIKTSHKQLGEGLVRACVVTFYHAVMLIGVDTEFGKEIDKSTMKFLDELEQSWS